LSAYASAGAAGNCENCHADSSGHLPFDEWLSDAHSQTLENIRFMTMYNGTDVWGNQSPLTRYICSPDYGCVPLPPDPTQPYYGPGYRLDFPDTSGNCAACHAPAAAIDQPYNIDPNQVSGVGAEGVACDFCHKIWEVNLNQTTGLPNINMPGVMSYEYRRPPEGHQFFAGPFDDVAPGEDTFSPLQTQSQFCAPCHFAQFWDVVVYNSFGEWLESPYSDPKSGQTCQDCHMPPGFHDRFARADQGGLTRDPQKIFSHRMPGALDANLLENALSLEVETTREGGQVEVEVLVINDKTGHHVPTDSPLRHLILLVEAFDTQGNTLDYAEGPALPDWCGEGDPEQGYYAGLPGKVYAKILEERWTKITPTGAYWNQTRVVEDNRIPALGRDRSVYYFFDNSSEPVVVKVTLLYRRAFMTLVDQKGWDPPDIQMEAVEISLD
jgi:nitrate/TMAO reductase-like tetraheme cytochrome c subunit